MDQNGKIPTQTVDVWPWSELVPMLLEDMTARYERGDWPTHPPYKPPPDADPDPDQEYIHTANAVVSPLNSINQSFTPYDNSYFMPLHDFVQHPLVRGPRNVNGGNTLTNTVARLWFDWLLGLPAHLVGTISHFACMYLRVCEHYRNPGQLC